MRTTRGCYPSSPPLCFSLCVLFILIYTCGSFADIPFDVTQQQYCLKVNGGCSFFNSSIWVGGVVPSGVDVHANITGTSNFSSPLLLYIDSSAPQPFILGGLFVHFADFEMRGNATLQASFITVHDYGVLALKPYSITTTTASNAYPNPAFFISPTGTLTVEDDSSLIWYP